MILLILKTLWMKDCGIIPGSERAILASFQTPPQKSIVRGIEWVEELIVLDPAGSGCIPGGWLDCL